MNEVNKEHEILDEEDLPMCCSKCPTKVYVLAGFSCGCRKLKKLNQQMK